jgi:hypothetical protein
MRESLKAICRKSITLAGLYNTICLSSSATQIFSYSVVIITNLAVHFDKMYLKTNTYINYGVYEIETN